ncbi:uncharacterized protein LOC143283889 [Babylonia areolata]|uniref:uncharacterized protein LOC143283889 n=1 Tax=Babylonia areolata TaxID=304850 RepID=UPI003FD321BE
MTGENCDQDAYVSDTVVDGNTAVDYWAVDECGGEGMIVVDGNTAVDYWAVDECGGEGMIVVDGNSSVCLTSVLCLTSPQRAMVRGQSSANCHRYNAQDLDTSQCSSSLRQHDNGDFTDLLTLMTDALNQEHYPQFTLKTTVFMYEYLHCASSVQAYAELFYGVPEDRMPPSSSGWWTEAYSYLQQHGLSASGGGGPVGRRRRSFTDGDNMMLLQKVQDIARTMHPSCVQWLIDHFVGNTKKYFLRTYPNFPSPYPYTPTPTTTTTTTTTATGKPGE